jgi:hypothetical protein
MRPVTEKGILPRRDEQPAAQVVSDPGRHPSAVFQEAERCAGQFAIVTRSQESSFERVVVEDPRAREMILVLERIEHEDPALPG